MKHSGSLFIVLFSIWLLWSGHYTSLLLTLGLFSCLLVLLMMRRMGAIDHEAMPIEITLRMLGYLPWLGWQIVKANLSVARRIVQPRMPVRPHILKVHAGQRSDIGRVVYANSITLTPGTVTIGVNGDEFTIHALTDDAAAGVTDDEMNDRVCAVEGRR
jgi:multicomponent Na+:H+ antiporter subunit E